MWRGKDWNGILLNNAKIIRNYRFITNNKEISFLFFSLIHAGAISLKLLVMFSYELLKAFMYKM